MTAALAPRVETGPELDPDDDCPPPFDGMRVSEEDYWAHYYEGPEEKYEWNNGVLEEKGVSDRLTCLIYDWFVELLIEYLRAHPIAERVGLETGFRLELPRKTAIRRPDYALIRRDNPRRFADLENSYKGIYDVCIEALSTTKRKYRDRDLIHKKAEYAAAGVREYYILHHKHNLRGFYRLGPDGLYAPMPVSDEGVISSEVLPGLRWRLGDLERRPPMATLIDDPVYRDFVRLDLQQERAEATAARVQATAAEAREAAERARAEQAERERLDEHARAEQAERERLAERARAERLAERLRALGIDSD